MYQHLYSRFIAANPKRQHFACHSHYFWPDVTREAHMQYWDDTASYVDDKWGYFFQTCIPQVQQKIAAVLNVPAPDQIVFAPNTHELLYRILSCLPTDKTLNVLTTDSEFHSFSRQIARLEESARVKVTRVTSAPYADFSTRMIAEINNNDFDLVFFSQVFFNSGVVVDDVEAIVSAVTNPETLVVVDGYHGFMAKPTDLSQITQRAFYLAGSYKYAQGGEGACFAVVPEGCELRPEYTGWYAEFGELSAAKTGEVKYSKNGMRFAGATMDFSAIYRLLAVLNLFEQEGLTVEKINRYIQSCQQAFLAYLDELQHPLINRDALLCRDLDEHGHFLTFELPDADVAGQLHDHLAEHGVLTDYRGNRLRFGFALYHVPEQYDLSCLAGEPR
ncbi:aminotransferase class V-fold PLP-dependent enzyme [Alteromonas facilis]|uniref:aminotransferase class V-fold PLP-dependent enzyme n=1 Tax=Alteromonas facilis TaxID=2048004 RepID=UPI000C29098B|nr:aminotransferase class V-fold PLP-dependent enzyme [Alteromonas facilis]